MQSANTSYRFQLPANTAWENAARRSNMHLKKKKKYFILRSFLISKGKLAVTKKAQQSKGKVNHPLMFLHLQSSSQAPVSSVQKMQKSLVSGSLSGHSWDI